MIDHLNKFSLTVHCETVDELKAYLNAERNQLLLELLYTEVFRPILKYGQDDTEILAFQMVWDRLSDYLGDI